LFLGLTFERNYVWMTTATSKYLGQLRIESEHTKSGKQLLTDAPMDNNGKGEAFSPTDLVATALANCMLTVIGIKANSWGKDLGQESGASIVKSMASAPRRISQIDVELNLYGDFSDEERQTLKKIAQACPVARSLHPDLKQEISIVWH
jgi:putative redox protein